VRNKGNEQGFGKRDRLLLVAHELGKSWLCTDNSVVAGAGDGLYEITRSVKGVKSIKNNLIGK
jgi:hypothetical protein